METTDQMAEVEAVLKSVGRWFRDPQLLYDPEPDESFLAAM